MVHALVEIPQTEWLELRDLYLDQKTDSLGCQMLDNFIDWKNKESSENIKIYALDGVWRNDGTFLLIFKFNLQAHVFFNTLDDELARLIAALNCLDTNTNYLLSGFSKRLKPAVDAFLVARNVQNKVSIDSTYWHHVTKELIDSFDVTTPPGITLSTIDVKYATQINEIWPHRAPGSIEFVKRLLTYNANVGAFDVDGNLIAWCLRLPSGALGVLQVSAQHKRAGLGGLIVRSLSKTISSLGSEVLAPVVCTNTPSLKMFEKLRFKIIDEVSWAFVPADDNEH